MSVFSEDRESTNWANLQHNLGNAFLSLGKQSKGSKSHDHLLKSVAAYEHSLRVRTEKDKPAQWAMTQNGLGRAYSCLAPDAGEDATKYLEKSLKAHLQALCVNTESAMPAAWAKTQEFLGIAYLVIAAQNRDEMEQHLIKAIEAFKHAGLWYSKIDDHKSLAIILSSIGAAYRQMGKTSDDVNYLMKSVSSYERALEAVGRTENPNLRFIYQHNLGLVYWAIANQSIEPVRAAYLGMAKNSIALAIAEYGNTIDSSENKQAYENLDKVKSQMALVPA